MNGASGAAAHSPSRAGIDIEDRLSSILPPRPRPTLVPADSVAPVGRYDGDVGDPHAVVDYLRSWDTLTALVDEHLATGDHEPYLTAIGRARLASGASVIVAKHAVELLVARRARQRAR